MDTTPTGIFWRKRRVQLYFFLALGFAISQLVSARPAFSQSQPHNIDGIAAQATAAREQNDIPRAIELYSQGVQQKPDWSEGLWFLGSLQYGVGDYASARDALTRFLALNSNASPAMALRGLCEFETQEYAQALNDIQQAVSLGAANQPRNERILRYHEALLLTRNGRFEDALRAYKFFAHDEDANADLLAGIGLAGLRTQLLPIELPEDQKPLFIAAGYATLHFMAGDGKAPQAFTDLFERFPNAANTHYLYGHLLYSTEPEQALVELQRETEITPSNAPAWVLAAWILLLKEKPAEALLYAKHGVEAAPNVSTAQMVLGRSLLETGDTKGGLEHLEKALQLEPNNLETHIALVKAYSMSGRKEDAKRERLQCLQLVASGE
jgi:tetratricopeptide (TPR) repeat protein